MRALLDFLNCILPNPLKNLLTKILGATLFYSSYKPTQFHRTDALKKLLNTRYFDYYFYKNRHLNNEELNHKFWKEWGAEYLTSFNKTPIPEYYLKEIEGLIETKNVKAVFELGCGFLRHLEYLASKYPHLELYGIDITPQVIDRAEELNDPRIRVFVDDVRNIKKYKDILKKADLIFSYGIFAYLNPADLEKVCNVIQKYFRGYVVYNDTAQKRDLGTLTQSIELSGQSYIHPYPAIFKKYGLKEITSGYSPDEESFNFVGGQT